MNRTPVLLAALLAAASGTAAGLAACVIRYNGPANGRDYAADVAVGPDGSIYVAGTSAGEGTGLDFTVLCFSPEESLRWACRWNRSGSSDDVARAVAVGPDGNIYAAGFTVAQVPYYDVAVLSLTPDGALRWVQVHAGEGGGEDSACAMAVDADNNIYTVGVGDDIFGENLEFSVLSFEPDTGGLRWVYVASADYIDGGTDIAVGPDSTVFASGRLWWGSSPAVYAVAAVNTADGSERWLHTLRRGNDDSGANGIACSGDRVYAAGFAGGSNYHDFAVTAHNADTGGRDWAWYYSAGTGKSDRAFDVAVGPDGNVYACGRTIDDTIMQRFSVVSIAPDGTGRWIYADTTGPWGRFEAAEALVVGPDSRVYAAGWRDANWPYTADEAVVQCLDSAGVLQWVYRFDNIRDSVDLVEAIALGTNGRVYAVGSSYDNWSNQDMLILSIEASPAVNEPTRFCNPNSVPGPSVVRGMLLLSASGAMREASGALLDAAGRRVMALAPGPNDVSMLAPGVYFLRTSRANSPRRVLLVR